MLPNATMMALAGNQQVRFHRLMRTSGLEIQPCMLGRIQILFGKQAMTRDKSFRGNASQFFIAGELCRRGHAAVVTLGNTPNVDVLCSNAAGTPFAHIQVKTFEPGNRTCSVGLKAVKDFGPTFFWVLGGIPSVNSKRAFEYYVIPSSEMAKHVLEANEKWLITPGKSNRIHQENKMRTVHLPPYKSFSGWDISPFRDRWDLIDNILKTTPLKD